MNKALIVMAAGTALLLASAPAHGYGAARCGYSYRGPGGGVYHTSTTAAYGPYGEHTATRTTGYTPATGVYHTGSGQTSGYGGSAYHYSAGGGGAGYGYGGYSGAYGTAGYAGAYRRW